MDWIIKIVKLLGAYFLGLVTVQAAMSVSVVILLLFIFNIVMMVMGISAIHKLGYTANVLKLFKNTMKEFSMEAILVCLAYCIDDIALHHIPYIHFAEYVAVAFLFVIFIYLYLDYSIITTKKQGLKFMQNLLLHNASNLVSKYGIKIDQEKLDKLNLTEFAKKIVKKEAEQ